MPRLPPLTINAWLRVDLICRLLGELEDVESVLEIGAGEGALGVRLASRYRYVGLERDARSSQRAAARFGRAKVASIVHGDLSALASDETFDLIAAFEVLEHYEDDQAQLENWVRHLRSRGWLILSVPAFAGRFGPGDRKVGHYRRYERQQLADTLTRAGLEPRSIQAYGFPLGNALERARDVIARLSRPRGPYDVRTAESGRWLQPPEYLGWLTQSISAPGRVLQRRFLETERGTGFVASAQKMT
jgi:SAM-dependent methyltransferase